MKALLNWRYYVMIALLGAGLLLVFAAVGSCVSLLGFMTEILCRLVFAASGIGTLCVMHRLTEYWGSRNEIPEFTNQKV